PEPLPPISATFSGELKKSAMPFLSPSVVEPSSHISRKNAIIAVTKSAYAIFHAPPWAPWPAFFTRLMMIGWSFFESPDITEPLVEWVHSPIPRGHLGPLRGPWDAGRLGSGPA